MILCSKQRWEKNDEPLLQSSIDSPALQSPFMSSTMSTVASKRSSQSDEKAEINELIKQINLTILNLQRKRLHLSRELNVAIRQKAPKIEEVGEDKADTLGSNSNAIDENSDKINRLKTLVQQFDEKIKEAQSTKDNLNKLAQSQLDLVSKIDDKEKLNEDGLPFMDIQEEVDEDGNVISSKVNNVPVEVEKKAKASTNVEKPSSVGKVKKDHDNDDELAQLFSDMELLPSHDRLKQHLNQDELLDRIDELKISPEEKFNLKRVCIQAFKAYNEKDEETEVKPEKDVVSTTIGNSESKKHGIDTDNLLELELLADEFDNEEENEDSKYADDEDWDYDFEENDDDDDDDDDDDVADELLYGSKPNTTWLGGNIGDSKSSDLFWSQVAQLRQKEKTNKVNDKHGLDVLECDESSKSHTDGKKKQKSVRFSDSLDIKNVENISDSVKNPEPFKKTSLFKQNRTKTSSADNETVANDGQLPVNERIVEETIVERDTDDKIIEDIVIEKSVDDSLEKNELNLAKPKSHEIRKKPVSRFKASQKNVPGLTSTYKPEKLGKEVAENNEKDEKMIPVNTQLDYSSMQDTDTMAKAYLMGMYDDDIDVDGPLVEELKDFEHINKMVESKKQDSRKAKTSTNGDAYDKMSNEVGMDYEETMDIDDYDDNEAMINDIEEHEFGEDDNELFIDENDVTNEELSESYYRMREKMLLKNRAMHEEQGFEPTDKEGKPIRISKFKSRMNK